MLAEGKISVGEAERLLQLTSGGSGGSPGDSSAGRTGSYGKTSDAKYIRVVVEPHDQAKGKTHVNIRVPLKIIRAGVNLASLIPGEASDAVQEKLRDKGMDFNISRLDDKSLDALIEGLQELSVDVVDDKQHVRVFVE